MRRIAAVVVALCAIRGPCHAADSAPDPAAITVSHIQAGVLSAHAQRQALRIEYRWKNQKRQPTQADGHVRRVVAANRRGQLYLDNGPVSETLTWDRDPYRKLTYISGDSVEVLRPLDRVVERYATTQFDLQRDLPHELVTLLGWWPFLGHPEPDLLGRKLSIDELASNDGYLLRDEPEGIDGRACRVIEVPQIDVVWIDVPAGFVVRRRDLYHPLTQAVGARIEYQEYTECGEGVSLPYRVVLSEFDAAATEASNRGRVVTHLIAELTDVACNAEVDLDASALELPPGTVRKQENRFEVVTPGEDEFATTIAEWAAQAMASGASLPRARTSWTRSDLPLLGCVGAVIGSLLSMLAMRRH